MVHDPEIRREIDGVLQQARDHDVPDQSWLMRPFRAQRQRDEAHHQGRQREAQEHIAERTTMRQADLGSDETGTPQQHEQCRDQRR